MGGDSQQGVANRPSDQRNLKAGGGEHLSQRHHFRLQLTAHRVLPARLRTGLFPCRGRGSLGRECVFRGRFGHDPPFWVRFLAMIGLLPGLFTGFSTG